MNGLNSKEIDMFVCISPDGYYFKSSSIKKIEELRSATYMGYWCTKNSQGSWNELPVDVFYVETPDRSLGHSNYFGMFTHNEVPYITNAESAFSEPMTGSICHSGEVIVSRYRHNYIKKDGAMIDGGRDYTRTNCCKTIGVTVVGSEFIFSEKQSD
jgi:hypothetical protein